MTARQVSRTVRMSADMLDRIRRVVARAQAEGHGITSVNGVIVGALSRGLAELEDVYGRGDEPPPAELKRGARAWKGDRP